MKRATMRPKDCFVLACRVLGLWQLFDAAAYTLSILNMVVGLSNPPAGYTIASYFTQTIGAFFFALILLVGAPVIASLFYPEPPVAKDNENRPSSSNMPPI